MRRVRERFVLPAGSVAKQAVTRLRRAQKRDEAKSRTAAELLAVERSNGVSARSWRAAVLARVVEGKVDKG